MERKRVINESYYDLFRIVKRRMEIEEVKEWIKNHRKEIIITTVSVGGGIISYFLLKKNNPKIKKNLELRLSFLNNIAGNDGDAHIYCQRDRQSLRLSETDLKLKDLGKLGVLIADRMPYVPKDLEINYLDVDYGVRVIKEREIGKCMADF